jgi:hypothetical protein
MFRIFGTVCTSVAYAAMEFFHIGRRDLIHVVHGKFSDILFKIRIIVVQVVEEYVQLPQVGQDSLWARSLLGRDQVPGHEPRHGLEQFHALGYGKIVWGLFVFK